MKGNHCLAIGVISAAAVLGAVDVLRAGDVNSGTAAPMITGAKVPEQRPLPPGAVAAPVNSGNTSPTEAAAAPATAGAPGAITPEQLGTMLVNLGCDVTDLGGGQQQVHSTRGAWNINITVQLSPDNTVLWYTVVLGGVADPNSVPSSVWTALLSANQNYGCTFSLIMPQTGASTLQLTHAIPNSNITPMNLRKNLELMDDLVISEAQFWNPANWPKSQAPATAPAAK